MKKVLFILFAAFSTAANAQNAVPKSATDIAPLLIGEKIPNSILKSSENATVSLSDVVSKKKTVLVFYRGGWCPYCNLHLSALAEAEKQILDLGYQIVAISPDSPENLRSTAEIDKVQYMLLSDANGVLIKEFGIAFEAPENYKSVINVHSNGMNTSLLPVPSVFVVNTNGDILFEYVSPDFKHRITAELLVSVLKTLK
ncbi:AhpC/TSA family protein [Flavobacterium circumlabens]|uniref:thioredoxin-dependent peroxiredoxin n=1 Tax=Flavobacterium circumlabens TaxID=2133765 RepID=A0A4Y7UA28_9FLAO|nr:peroxiredoxin-like family protein [Flavobacterium circumlabens]TCN56252.1 peroxiredoxin [Flavobacterium circumlabens]TEB43297.1 AhpC/TSA family protein [Flavobacterium circumlabens]